MSLKIVVLINIVLLGKIQSLPPLNIEEKTENIKTKLKSHETLGVKK